MDERLKNLMQELGNAINESLSESDRIAEAIGEIRRAGYDIFLVLEATIGFNKKETEPGGGEFLGSPEAPKAAGEESHSHRLRWTSQDQKFLRALRIAVDEEPGA